MKKTDEGLYSRFVVTPDSPITIENLYPDSKENMYDPVLKYKLLPSNTDMVYFDQYGTSEEMWTSGLTITPDELDTLGYSPLVTDYINSGNTKVVVRVEKGKAELFIPTDGLSVVKVYK